jgi:hypothetical protein
MVPSTPSDTVHTQPSINYSNGTGKPKLIDHRAVDDGEGGGQDGCYLRLYGGGTPMSSSRRS